MVAFKILINGRRQFKKLETMMKQLIIFDELADLFV